MISNIPYGQFVRMRRICSKGDDFQIKAQEMAFLVPFFGVGVGGWGGGCVCAIVDVCGERRACLVF